MTVCAPECSSRYEWIMYATAVSKLRYSAAVNATPRYISFFSLLFFRLMHLPYCPGTGSGSDAARKASDLPQALRGRVTHARSTTELTLSLRSPSLLFFLVTHFVLRHAASIFRPLSFPLPPPAPRSLVCLVFEGTFARQKAFHRGTPNSARVIKSSARGI